MKMKEMISNLAAYGMIRKIADNEFQKAKQMIDANYNQNTALYQKMINKAEQDRDALIQDAMEKTIAKVDKAIAAVNADLDDYVIAPMSPEQNSLLGVLNNLKDTGISDQEADLFYRQIQNNYTAKRMGLPLLKKASGKEYPFIGYDEVKSDVDRLEAKIRSWVVNYNPTSYEHFEFSSTYERDLKNCDAHIEAFKTGTPFNDLNLEADTDSKLNEMMQQLEDQENAKNNAARDQWEKAIFGGN